LGACLSLTNCWFSLSPRLWHFLSHHQHFLITENHLCVLSSPRCEGIIGLHPYFLSPLRLIPGNRWPITTVLFVSSSNGPRYVSQGEGMGCVCFIHHSIWGMDSLSIYIKCSIEVWWMNNEWWDGMTFFFPKTVCQNTVGFKEITYGHQSQLAHRCCCTFYAFPHSYFLFGSTHPRAPPHNENPRDLQHGSQLSEE
jgi:hypothetical protein